MHNFYIINSQDEYLRLIELYTDKFGLLGGFFFSFIENIFPPIPIFVVAIANVSAFGGVLGFLVTFLGHYLGAYTVFIFFRKIVRPRFYDKLKETSKIRRFENWFSRRSFHSILMILSLPFVPYFIINIAAAFSDIGKRAYLVALGIGNALMIGFLSIVGFTFNKALANGELYALIYPLLLLLLAYIIGKVIEKKFDMKG